MNFLNRKWGAFRLTAWRPEKPREGWGSAQFRFRIGEDGDESGLSLFVAIPLLAFYALMVVPGMLPNPKRAFSIRVSRDQFTWSLWETDNWHNTDPWWMRGAIGFPRHARALAMVAVLGAIAALSACNLQRCSEGANCAISNGAGPSAIPSPTVAASPSPSPSPTASPTNPCAAPVTGVNLSGPTSVPIGTVFALDVTPVNASGPLEGALDYCNNGRVPFVKSMSANLRCSGECSGYKPQFVAQGVGPFEIVIGVDLASAVFAGTVTR